MRQLLLLALLLSLAANAQIRYYFGDDPRWADPQFDDSAWPVVEKDAFPAPPQQGNGFVWVRQRVTAPAGDAALWLRLTHDNWSQTCRRNSTLTDDWQAPAADSHRIPTSTARFMKRSSICPLGVGTREVLVARRIWAPACLRGTSVALPAIEIGSRDGIRLAALRARDSSLLDNSLLIGYDPGGSVRQLTEATGAVTDTYSHDAFGNTIGRTGTTMNPYQYRGKDRVAVMDHKPVRMVEGQVLLRIGRTFIITGYFLTKSHKGFYNLPCPRARPSCMTMPKWIRESKVAPLRNSRPFHFEEEKNQ